MPDTVKGFVLPLSCALVLGLGPMAILPAASQELPLAASTDDSLFVFGGRFHTGYFDESYKLFSLDYEGNYVVGAGYQHFFLEGIYNFSVGAEGGLALRFGEAASTELWTGAVLRYDGLVLGDAVRISPSVTFGVSAVTDTMGKERAREIRDGSDATVLFYLAPEISLSLADHPGTEAFWRLHHRSGAWGTISGIGEGANANSFGVRWRF